MNAESVSTDDPNDQQEEAARADMYGLLASLFFRPPQSSILEAIASSASQADSLLGDAWTSLADACKRMDEAQVHEEYDRLFVGVGKAEIMLYGSYYLSGFLMEKPLAELRTDLAEMGLERPPHIAETEDHVSSLFEIMRMLILSDDAMETGLTKQKQFYAKHIQPWIHELCDAIESHPAANFYKSVANLTRQFADIESQAFDMN